MDEHGGSLDEHIPPPGQKGDVPAELAPPPGQKGDAGADLCLSQLLALAGAILALADWCSWAPAAAGACHRSNETQGGGDVGGGRGRIRACV